jgi:hypothetical protein
MQRNTAIALGLLVALGLALIFTMGHRAKPATTPSPAASASVHAVIATASASASASPAPSPESPEAMGNDSFDTLPDGRKVPELPASAPKQVGFGVVVVAYQGAQAAGKDARSKADAKTKAEALLMEARHDFAAAVAKGDAGSTSDAGHVPRDVLEPVIEYQIFSLKKGDVAADIIDTPRGYWIVRRND